MFVRPFGVLIHFPQLQIPASKHHRMAPAIHRSARALGGADGRGLKPESQANGVCSWILRQPTYVTGTPKHCK